MITDWSNSMIPSTLIACLSVWARASLLWNTPHWMVTPSTTTLAVWTSHLPTSRVNLYWWRWTTLRCHRAVPVPLPLWNLVTCCALWAAVTRVPTAVSVSVSADSPRTRRSTTFSRLSRLVCLSYVNWVRFGSWCRRELIWTRSNGASTDHINLDLRKKSH